MTKVTIISGFLGAGKTTFIRKLIEEVYAGEKIVLIENEYGEIGIDAGFLKDAGVQITEMNSGCICCTLVGDFTEALQKVVAQFQPERIIIEPSGVGKLSDIVVAVEKVKAYVPDLAVTEKITVVDVKKAKLYLKNFGEFFKNQVESASTVVLSRTQLVSDEKLAEAVALIRQLNAEAPLVTTPWTELKKEAVLNALENSEIGELDLSLLDEDDDEDEHEQHHHHHHHDHDEDHEHHHDDDDDDDDDDHEHEHHHDHDEEEDHEHDHEHEHEHHHHDHDHHHHHHHHHGEHDADEVFDSWGRETSRKYTEEELSAALKTLQESDEYGTILRAKGIVAMTDGSWKQFDLVPEEAETRACQPDYTSRLCVIGCDLKEDKLAELFSL